MTTSDKQETCIGCGALVPMSDGPVHAYLGASAGCWAIFGEVMAREYSDFRYAKVHHLSVDAYALQHPGTPQPQTIQSAAVHLISLYRQLEHGDNAMEAAQVKQRATQFKDRFTWLEPPESLGAMTIMDVYAADDANKHVAIVTEWAQVVWQAWADHHPVVDWR